MATKRTAPKPEYKLPDGIVLADLQYPEHGHHLPYETQRELGLDYSSGWTGRLTFYYIPAGRKAPEWVLTTLLIGKGKGTPDRYYGIGVADSKVYTVGRGPHVVAEIEVHPSADNIERLRPYIELWKKGMEDASAIRNRISSRRAQGQLYRAAGRTSWMW